MNDGKARSKIAVIDDDPAMLTVISAALEPDHEVTVYADPREALAAFRSGFVPDVMMPHTTGSDLHLQVREIPVLVPVPFLFLTTMSDRSHQRQGVNYPALKGGA